MIDTYIVLCTLKIELLPKLRNYNITFFSICIKYFYTGLKQICLNYLVHVKVLTVKKNKQYIKKY